MLGEELILLARRTEGETVAGLTYLSGAGIDFGRCSAAAARTVWRRLPGSFYPILLPPIMPPISAHHTAGRRGPPPGRARATSFGAAGPRPRSEALPRPTESPRPRARRARRRRARSPVRGHGPAVAGRWRRPVPRRRTGGAASSAARTRTRRLRTVRSSPACGWGAELLARRNRARRDREQVPRARSEAMSGRVRNQTLTGRAGRGRRSQRAERKGREGRTMRSEATSSTDRGGSSRRVARPSTEAASSRLLVVESLRQQAGGQA